MSAFLLPLFQLLLISPFSACQVGDNKINQLDHKHVAMFVFGDSISNPGNNNFLNISGHKANFPPYGETFFKFPTGRMTDGRLIADFIASYAGLPLWRPYLQPGAKQFRNGANFASIAGGVLNITKAGVFSLWKQLSYFKQVAYSIRQELGLTESEKLLMNAVYLMDMGGVDYHDLFKNNPTATKPDQEEFSNMVLGNITLLLKELYQTGARKFAILNVGARGCEPVLRQMFEVDGFGCLEEVNGLVRRHNHGLKELTNRLKRQLPGFTYLIFDYYQAMMDRIRNPSKYGFKVGTEGCCGSGTFRGSGCGYQPYELCQNPSEYLFFDGSHPCEHACSQLAELLWNGESDVTWPYNMKQLLELEAITEEEEKEEGEDSMDPTSAAY